MSKKTFLLPFVTPAGVVGTGNGDVVGPGSGQGTTDPDERWDWEFWSVVMEDFPSIYDFDTSDEPGTWNDYVKWWQSHSDWTETQFIDANGVGYAGPAP